MAHHVVILGTGPAGVPLAHKLFKDTAPVVKDLKITLVSLSTHIYWNPGSVRSILPGELPDETMFRDVRPAFQKYKERFEFVQGKVTALNPAENTVAVETPEGVKTISYDHVVIATGSRVAGDLPFKLVGTKEETAAKLAEYRTKIGAAKRITVAGAGATGVEFAAELGYKYGTTKTITLLASQDKVLPGLMDSVRGVAERELKKLHVNIVHNARVTDFKDNKIALANGETLETDLYLPVFGVIPNTEFVPAEYLDDTKSLDLELTFRLKGLKNVWGTGDAGNLEYKQAAKVDAQTMHLAANLHAVLTGNEAGVTNFKASGKITIFVLIGRKSGVGEFGGWKVPGFIVAWFKGKTVMAESALGMAAGTHGLRAPL